MFRALLPSSVFFPLFYSEKGIANRTNLVCRFCRPLISPYQEAVQSALFLLHHCQLENTVRNGRLGEKFNQNSCQIQFTESLLKRWEFTAKIQLKLAAINVLLQYTHSLGGTHAPNVPSQGSTSVLSCDVMSLSPKTCVNCDILNAITIPARYWMSVIIELKHRSTKATTNNKAKQWINKEWTKLHAFTTCSQTTQPFFIFSLLSTT